MSKPTDEELAKLRAFAQNRDDESYHAEFDDLLHRKLAELDSEWEAAMEAEYEQSGMSRWYA